MSQSVPLTVVDGRRCVEIADHKGEIHAYAFEVTRDSGGVWQVRLEKLDGKGVAWIVTWTVYGWTCTCPNFGYRREVRRDGCKHVKIAQGVRALLEAGVIAKGG